MIGKQLTLPAGTQFSFLHVHGQMALGAPVAVRVIERLRAGWLVEDQDGDAFAVTSEALRRLTAPAPSESERALRAKHAAEVRALHERLAWGEYSAQAIKREKARLNADLQDDLTRLKQSERLKMPADVEAMVCAVAPTFEREGLSGVFVLSRTPEDRREHGEHFHAYRVTGAGAARSCDCPAGRRGRKCWHLDAADLDGAWEAAARELYAALASAGTATPEKIGRAITRTWEDCKERQPPTLRTRRPDVVGAMRAFIALSSALCTKIYAQQARIEEVTR